MFKSTLAIVLLAFLAVTLCSPAKAPCCGEIIDEFDLMTNEVKSFFYNQTERSNCFRFSIKRSTKYESNDHISFLLPESMDKNQNYLIFTLMNEMGSMKKQTETGHSVLTQVRNRNVILKDEEYTSFWLQSFNGELSLRHEYGPKNFSEPLLKYNQNIGFKVGHFVVTESYSSKAHWQIKLADCSELPK